MCGILGVVGASATAERARVLAARALMFHRGPDDAGLWESPDVLLGAQRLAIIDLSPLGHQPMVSDDGRDAIVFNGEIYNFRELRRELAATGPFRSQTDTEVLLRGYRAWGLRRLLSKIDGMFAFAIWDGHRRQLAAARDRAGKKPFFFQHEAGVLRFASVLTSLVEMLPGTPAVDAHAIDSYLVYQAVPSPLSIFSGVRQLAPAHALTFTPETGACRVEQYWEIRYGAKTRESERDVIDHVETLVRAAVRKRLVADVKVGVFLSGGVDSSLVTAIAAQESSTPIEAVTLGFDEPAFDERNFARAVARENGVRLHEELLRPELVADLPSIVWHYGQPVADVSIVPSHYLAQVARPWMQVALNGDGGDEVFGGYTRPLLEWVVGPYRERVPLRIRERLSHLAAPGGGRPMSRRLDLVLRAGGTDAEDAFTYDRAFRGLRGTAYADPLRGTVGDWDPDVLYRLAWEHGHASDAVDRALAGDFNTYLPDQLLTKADRASMAHSLEARSPLLDTALVEYATTIPNGLRFRYLTTKYILKRLAARYAPEYVIYRRKRGFVMPASQWIRGELAPYVRAALDNRTFYDRGWIQPEFVRRMLSDHVTGARDWGEQIWTLLVLEVWARLTLDGTLARDARMDAFLSTPGRPPRTRVRTLQVGMEWFPERPGGLNRVFYELARHLPEAGVEVTGLVAGTEAVSRDSDGVVEGFAPHSDSLVPRIVAVTRRGRALVRSDPRTLVVSHFALYTYPLLTALGDRPLVVHFQGPWGLEGRAERQSGLAVAAKTAIERAVYARATAFIVLSTPFQKILEEQFGVPASRIHVIPGGVDVSRFAIGATRAECRARLGWPTDRKVVLAVRRLTRRMGLDHLIDAAVRLRDAVPDVLVLIAGRGAIADELNGRILERGVGDHVRLVGFIPDEDLAFAYRAADLSIVPSVTLEGFGLIVAESLAAGTPVLVTPVGGLPEAVGTLAPQLVLRDSSADAIADGLIGALTGATPLPTPAACEAYARAHYDWAVIAARVRDVYEQAAR